MQLKTVSPTLARLYDKDFLLWTEEIARLLRARRLDELDIEHIAEEIEDMGKSQRKELESRLAVLLVHLLKWGWQRDKRSNSWKATVANQRAEIRRLFRQSPSLRTHVPDSLAECYADAVEEASLETGLPADTLPQRCPFTPEQILDRDFLPE